MSTINISMPNALKAFVEAQVRDCGYSSSSEYVRELIRRDQDRHQLRDLLLEGAASAPGPAADTRYFDGLRKRTGAANP